MSLTIRQTPKVLIREGSYPARCFAVIDLGIQHSKTYDVNFPKVMLGWELDKITEDNKRYIHWQAYTASLGIYAKLRILIECWRGENLSPNELENFKLETLLGLSCYVTIKHYISRDKQINWATIEEISPLPSDVSCPELQNKLIHFDLDYYTEENHRAVPEFIRKKINIPLTA